MMKKKWVLLPVTAIILVFMFFTTTSLAADGQGSLKKGISQRVETLENLFVDLKDKVLGMDTDIQNLKEAHSATDSNLAVLKQVVTNQSKDITLLKQTIEDENKKITDLTNEVTTIRSDLDQLSSGDNTNQALTVKGKVTTVDGKPVQGADIMLTDEGTYYGTSTDSQGNFSIDVHARDAGTYPLLVSEKGYLLAIKMNVTVNQQTPTATVNLIMTEGGTIAGKVAYEDNVTVDRTSIKVYNQDGEMVNRVFVNADGSYHLNAPEGKCSLLLEVYGSNAPNQTKTVTVIKGQTVTQDFTIE